MKKIFTTIIGVMAFCSAMAIVDKAVLVDVNCDGNITTADDSLTIEQVDINGDGKVDTADVVEVYVEMKKGLKGSAPDSDDTEFGY